MLLVLRVSFFSPVVLLLSLFWCLTQIRTTGTKQTDCTWWWYFASSFRKMRNLLGNSWPLLRELYWSFVLRSSLLVVQISNTKCSIFSASEIMCVSSVLLFGKTKDEIDFLLSMRSLLVVVVAKHNFRFGCDDELLVQIQSKYCSRLDYRVRIMFVVDYSENNFFLDCARK